MPYAIKDLQSRIDQKTKEQAEADWAKATRQCVELMKPFFGTAQDWATPEERTKIAEDLPKHFKATSYGTIIMFNEMHVPAHYVRKKQNEAAEDFLKKIENLRDDVDSLLCEVEGMQR